MKTWINTRGRIFWYDQYALNEQETAFARYDPVRIADEIAGTGADIVAVYATNQFGIAYYPSKIWPMHPTLKGRDYFGRVSRELRKRGKKIIAYVNWLDSKHAEENVIPIQCQERACYVEQPLAKWAEPSRANGRVQALPGGGWRQICLNSPHREQVVAISQEIVERYHPDAFHVDMVVNQVCACRFCRPTLEKICGTKKVNAEILADHWPAYVDWRCERSASLIAEISAILRKRGIVALHNGMSPLYTPAVTGIGEQWLQSLDIYLSECFDAFRSPMTDLNSTSITVRWQQAVGKPAWILRTSTSPHHAHWPISPAQWQVHAAACKANGCKVFGPCGIGAYPDTTSSKAALACIRRAFDCFMEDADLDPGAAPVSKIALIFSWATRRYCRPQMDEHSDVAADWNGELVGWARFLIEDHLPFDIQIAEDITDSSQLARYDLVVLPNIANVSDAFCAVMREYVSRGGKLLATAETSLQDERGGRRDDFALREVLGVSFRGAINGCFAIERPQEPEPAAGAFQQVVPSGKAVARCVTVDPAGSVAGQQGMDPLPMKVTDWPVMVGNKFGRGQSNYVAFDIGRFYLRHGDEHIRMLMAEQVDALLVTRQIAVEAPRTVEVTVWEQEAPRRTIVHLANRTVAAAAASDTRHVSEIIPVHQIELRLKKPYPVVEVTGRHTEIKWRTNGNQLAISISKVGAYAAVMILPRPDPPAVEGDLVRKGSERLVE
ncbi:MAG: beta-galactosidase trimerization domain-containing protein [Verrucomicrobia bacterium]|nr:beta-galactosidase trimerization domain-containing protein [Verrucomicrobiota bacterium]